MVKRCIFFCQKELKLKVNKLFFYVLLPVFIGALVLDLVTKSIASVSLAGGESVAAIPMLFNFKYVQNFGAAWSMFSGNTVLLLIIAIIFIICLGVFYAYENKNGALFQVGIGLVFAGALEVVVFLVSCITAASRLAEHFLH